VLAPGFGVVRNKFIQPCPVGTYNDEIRLDSTSPCTPCFGGATTSVEGAATRDACNRECWLWGLRALSSSCFRMSLTAKAANA
jgi:hypothetical protein